jgi:hypothetical protein
LLRASLLLAPLALAFLGGAAPCATVDPDPILIDATFCGRTIWVRGVSERGDDLFVTITGARVAERFNRKGRIGPIWANTARLSVADVPKLCLIATGTRRSSELGRGIVDEHFLDLDAVARRATVEPAASDVELIRHEYVRLKQSQGLFGMFEGAVRVNTDGPAATYEAAFPWPDTAPPGEYAVHVLHVRGGVVVRDEPTSVRVEMTGLPRLIADLAFGHSELYGALSVFVALTVGFAMGLVFKRGGGH